jgi:hypothetical protein
MYERQRLAASFVHKECRLAVDGELKSISGPVVSNRSTREWRQLGHVHSITTTTSINAIHGHAEFGVKEPNRRKEKRRFFFPSPVDLFGLIAARQ